MNSYGEKYQLALELSFAEIFHNKVDGVLLIRYLPDTEIDLSKAKIVIESLEKPLRDGKTPYGITDAHAIGLNITPDARKVYRDNNTTRLTKKHGIILKGLSNRILANAFIQFDRPITPTKIFKDLSTAEAWFFSQR